MRKRNKNKPNQTGRNRTTRFARLDHSLLNSPAYRALSVAARALLVELTMLDNGENNGSLYLSIRDAAGRLGMADLSAVRSAFDELQELGFIEMTEDASFHVKAAEKSRARCWRLNWLAGPGRKGPSMTFMERQPQPDTKAHKRMERGMRALKAYRKDRDSGRLPVLDSDTLAGN
ncbi:hypothetical protein [Novosphingobium sp. EMRT-2]|uniref:hypothetical protein n=1 Tax=Novosphingobium sp. EMRT-2 TaxID=2571749 RepID=UPI0010BD30BF|nr:hypothetical protein [Novosphingobium sp. EMRT-2]QCI93903.1 hypothetical protein FA702_10305 [Novosphingobium sp. EMRT-2]